jgi:hypothetical protein
MTTTRVIRYTTHADAADQNQKLVEQVYADLATVRPDGLRYATFRLADGVTFVHVVTQEGDGSALTGLPAFAEFQRELAGRCAERPVVTDAALVGSYGVFGATVDPPE